MIDSAWFAGKLKEVRAAAGLTQAELAERMETSKSIVADLEQGRYQPTWKTVCSICNALGIKPDAFAVKPEDFESPGPGRPPKAPGRTKTKKGTKKK